MDRLLYEPPAHGTDHDRERRQPETHLEGQLLVDGQPDCRQDEDRPVDEVEGVGDAAEEAHRGEGQEPSRGPRQRRGTRGDHGGGPECGQQGRNPWIRSACVDDERCRDDRRETGPPDSAQRQPGDSPPDRAVEPDREQATEPELPGARRQ